MLVLFVRTGSDGEGSIPRTTYTEEPPAKLDYPMFDGDADFPTCQDGQLWGDGVPLSESYLNGNKDPAPKNLLEISSAHHPAKSTASSPSSCLTPLSSKRPKRRETGGGMEFVDFGMVTLVRIHSASWKR